MESVIDDDGDNNEVDYDSNDDDDDENEVDDDGDIKPESLLLQLVQLIRGKLKKHFKVDQATVFCRCQVLTWL